MRGRLGGSAGKLSARPSSWTEPSPPTTGSLPGPGLKPEPGPGLGENISGRPSCGTAADNQAISNHSDQYLERNDQSEVFSCREQSDLRTSKQPVVLLLLITLLDFSEGSQSPERPKVTKAQFFGTAANYFCFYPIIMSI